MVIPTDLPKILRGFRMWPVGGSVRKRLRELLREKYGYEMSDPEYTAPQVREVIKGVDREDEPA